jgi:nucleotide-binding universal stress UspA family protein
MGYRNIVVGTDGSASAELAVRHAAQLAAASGARTVVVTAYQGTGDELTKESQGVPPDLRWMVTDRNLAEEKARHGRELAREAGAGEVVVQTGEGDPTEVVLDTIEDFGADLVVVGSRGLGSPAHFLLGSVAGRLSHHAPCDVLIVHTV